jgi:hypothetical protein
MKKNWLILIIIILATGITFGVVKYGILKGSDSTLTDSSREGGESAKTNPDGSPIIEKNTAAKQDAQNSGGATETSKQSNNLDVPGSGSKTVEPVAEVKKIENNCFSYEYRHTKEAQDKDIEDFLDYSNAFAILHKDLNPKSVCVKVNNKPVPFKMNKNKSQDEVMIGAVVGPESVIKVSYCLEKVACKESCAVKSNRFMDDMMSDAGDEDDFKESWGDSNSAAHAAQKKTLQGKVKELRAVASENKDLAQRSVIRTWDTIQKNEWVCKK